MIYSSIIGYFMKAKSVSYLGINFLLSEHSDYLRPLGYPFQIGNQILQSKEYLKGRSSISVFDVGANKGQLSLTLMTFLNRMGKETYFDVFEPNKEITKSLARTSLI